MDINHLQVSTFSRLSELPVHTFKTNLCYKLFYPTTNDIKVDIKRAKDSKILSIVLCPYSWNFPLESVGNGFFELLKINSPSLRLSSSVRISRYALTVAMWLFWFFIERGPFIRANIQSLQSICKLKNSSEGILTMYDFHRSFTDVVRCEITFSFSFRSVRDERLTSEQRFPLISQSRKRRKSLFRRVSPFALGICFPALDTL